MIVGIIHVNLYFLFMDDQNMSENSNVVVSEKKPWLDTPKAIIVGAIILALGVAIGLGGGKAGTPAAQPAPTEAEVMNDLTAIAKKLAVSKDDFSACMQSDKYLAKITNDEKFVMDQGTPYNVIVSPKGVLALPGALPYEQFLDLVTQLTGTEAFDIPEEFKTNIDPTELVIRETDYVRGSTEAPVIIFEYSDIDCPFCKMLHPTLVRLTEEQPDTVAWVYRHHPLDNLHPFARMKAEASECIANLSTDRNGTFWKYLDLVMSN